MEIFKRFKYIVPVFLFTGQCFAQNPGDQLFTSSKIYSINLTLKEPGWWDSLNYYYKNGATRYMLASLTFDSIRLDSIGIRLKGNSSYGHPGAKKSIKLDLNRFVPNQQIDGLAEINLNNGFLDPTMMREKLFLDFLNEEKLAAPRCTFARVSYNGNYCGLFKIVEEVDKIFLETRFKSHGGNLFKGDPKGTLEQKGTDPGAYYSDYELKTNTAANDWSDLVNFIQLVNSDAPSFASGIRSAFDVDSYIKMWAANNLFANLDSYFCNPHNYYLYHHPKTGKFNWITWDVSTVFGVFPLWSETKISNLDLLYISKNEDSRPLSKNLLNNEEFRFEYLSDICHYLYNDLTPSYLFPKIDSLASRIRADIYAEPDSNRMYTKNQFEQNIGYGTVSTAFLWGDIPGLKAFVENRREEAIVQLCDKDWSCATNSVSKEGVIAVYPNPSSITVTLSFDLVEKDAPVTCSIFDMAGKEVRKETAYLAPGVNSHRMNIQTLPDGIYTLKVANGCKKFNQKIVVIR